MLARILCLSSVAALVCSISDDTRAGAGPGGSSRPLQPRRLGADADALPQEPTAPLTPTPSGASAVPGSASAYDAVDPRAVNPTPSSAPGPAGYATATAPTAPSSNMPPATQAPSPLASADAVNDLTAHVAAHTTINDSAVALVTGMAAQYVAAAPGNAAVAALSRAYVSSAEDFGHAITDSTPFAAPQVSPTQAQMGGTRSKR